MLDQAKMKYLSQEGEMADIDSFVKMLGECAYRYEWRIKDGGRIRGTVRGYEIEHCPIVAIADTMMGGGVFHSPVDVSLAGDAIGMTERDVSSIMYAADGEILLAGGERVYERIRSPLLRAVGLSK